MHTPYSMKYEKKMEIGCDTVCKQTTALGEENSSEETNSKISAKASPIKSE